VTLDSTRTIGGLKFGDISGSQNWVLTGANTLTLDAGSTNVPTIAVNQNTATIAAPLVGNYGLTKTGDGTLALSGTNTLGGSLVVHAGSVDVTSGSTTFGIGTSTVGYLMGSAGLTLSESSLALSGELRVGGSDQSGSQYIAAGTASLSNATLAVGALTVARGNSHDNSVSGTLTLNSGSTLVCTNDAIIKFAGLGFGNLVLNGGDFIISPTVAKSLVIGYWDIGPAELDITNGNLLLENSSSLRVCRGNNNTGANVINQLGGTVTFYGDAGLTVGGYGSLDLNNAGGITSSSTYNLNGGTLTVPQIIATSATGPRIFNFNGGILKAAANNLIFMGTNVARPANVRNGGAIIDTAGFSVTIGQTLQHSGLGGDNAIDGGLTKQGDGTLTLTGLNSYTGPTMISAGTLELQQPTLYTKSTVTIANGANLQLDFTTTNVIGTLVLNGVPQPSGIYNSNTAPGFITGPGNLQAQSSIAINPTNIAFTVSGGRLTLSWPADHTGWRLQAQTNSLGTNWFNVPGVTATDSLSLPLDPINGTVFYRLVYP
jgi:autotransporter-associated beta strand protein